MTGRLLLTALVALIVACVWAAVSDRARIAALAAAAEPVAVVQGKDAAWWSRRAVQARRDANKRGHTIQRLHRVLASNRDVQTAITLASVTFGVQRETLRRKAFCETGGTYSASAHNRYSGASGLYQFLPSTFASTPYGRLDIWDPYVNALAAGWMHRNGRGGEWDCQ